MVGFLASIAAVIFGWIPEGHFRLGHAILLCAASVATAFIASLLLGMASSQSGRRVGDIGPVCNVRPDLQLLLIYPYIEIKVYTRSTINVI